MKTTLKFIFLLASLIIAAPTYAAMIEETDLHFQPDTMALLKGDIQYSFKLMGPKKLLKFFPEARELDSIGALKEKKTRILITKSVFIVNKPIGFFDHEHMVDPDYISHIMGEQKVTKLEGNTFKVTVPGENGYSYKMKTFFDSDDISTLSNSRSIRGTTVARKLDVISQSAPSIVFKEFTNFSKYSLGGTSVQSYISLKEGRTLVITYQLTAIKKYYAIKNLLKSNFLKESQEVRTLMETFQED